MSELSSKFARSFERWRGHEMEEENALLEVSPDDDPSFLRSLANRGAPAEMVEFYGRVHEVSLPDVGNGFFLESAEDVVNGAGDWHPTSVTGSLNDSIIVFGTDGGGG